MADIIPTEADLNFGLLCRHNARITRHKVIVDIFRGSDIRRNKHKVAELSFSHDEAFTAFQQNNWESLVTIREDALNIPLTTYR